MKRWNFAIDIIFSFVSGLWKVRFKCETHFWKAEHETVTNICLYFFLSFMFISSNYILYILTNPLIFSLE